jgi:hypothetical protein
MRAIAGLILLLVALLYGVRPNAAGYEAPASSSPVSQLAPEAGLGTGFTYQGQLKKNGAPVNASCDVTFSLWDAAGSGSPPTGGNPIGGDQTVNGVTVSNGLFTVTLNEAGQFGANAFNGEARWLQTSVTCPGDSGATTLSPRQPVTPAPYALAAPGSAYDNVVIVAKSGGDFTSIQAALDSILDAGPGNPYLVWIAPGVYTESVILKPYVDVEGAGQQVTKITHGGGGSDSIATVVTASNIELRSLTVENTGGAAYAIAIKNDGTSPLLTDITAAIFSDNSASPTIRNSNLLAIGTGFNHYAVNSRDSSFHTIRDSSISAYGGSILNYGVVSTVNSTAYIFNSILWGTTAAVHMLNSTGRIAISEVVGGATTAGTGTLVCVGAYNLSFVALNATCQ